MQEVLDTPSLRGQECRGRLQGFIDVQMDYEKKEKEEYTKKKATTPSVLSS